MGQLYILIHRTACAFGPKSFSQTEPIQPRSIFQCKTTTTINFWARSFLCIIIQIATLRFLRSSFSWQINSLLKEQNLQDTEIVFRSFLELDCSEKKVDSVCVIFFILWSIQSFSHDTHCPAHCRSFATSLRFNGFFLCLCSPVLQKMLCGGFRESSTRRLELEDVNDEIFAEVLEFWCGKKLSDNEDVEHLLALAGIADRFQIGEIATSLEDYVVERLLRTSTCADVLATGAALGLRRAEAAARRMALERFDEVAATAGFLRLDEDTTYSILSHDALGAASEESALEAAAWWIAAGEGGVGLLRAVRFGLLGEQWFGSAGTARERLPARVASWVDLLLEEARQAKAVAAAGCTGAAGRGPVLLGPKALIPRTRRGLWPTWLPVATGADGLDARSVNGPALGSDEGRVASAEEWFRRHQGGPDGASGGLRGRNPAAACEALVQEMCQCRAM